MRPLQASERTMLQRMAASLPEPFGSRLIADIAAAHIAEEHLTPPDYWVIICLAGYERPRTDRLTFYPGLGVFGDESGNKFTLELFADENLRLLEVHFHQWTALPAGIWLPASFRLALSKEAPEHS